jgi:hypothetical protein
MVGNAVAIIVESRFCMNIAVATIRAVSRVRCETRLGSILGNSVMTLLWAGVVAEESTQLSFVKNKWTAPAARHGLAGVKADAQGAEIDLEREIGTVRADLEREIGLVRGELTLQIGLVRTDLTREITAMDTQLSAAIEILCRDMTIRLGTALFAGTGIIPGAMRLMLAHP